MFFYCWYEFWFGHHLHSWVTDPQKCMNHPHEATVLLCDLTKDEVDITMKAAKENEAITAEQHSRESVRIAQTVRELLKKFRAAYRKFHEKPVDDGVAQKNFDAVNLSTVYADDEVANEISVSKAQSTNFGTNKKRVSFMSWVWFDLEIKPTEIIRNQGENRERPRILLFHSWLDGEEKNHWRA